VPPGGPGRGPEVAQSATSLARHPEGDVVDCRGGGGTAGGDPRDRPLVLVGCFLQEFVW